MSTSSSDLAKAAIAALTEALEREGHPASPKDVQKLLMNAVDERAGTLTVILATPTGNAGALTQQIADAIGKKTGKNVEIVERKDPSIIGGAVVSYGDERIDLSVKRSLEDAELLLRSQQ